MTTLASTTAASVSNDQTITIANFDFDRAHREGWTLSDLGKFKDGQPHVELQKLDNPGVGFPTFREDKEAWAHVVKQARTGSLFHIQALALIDRRERQGIQTLYGCW